LRKPNLERPHPVGFGVQKIYRFENGYGASVVRFKCSTGDYGSYTVDETEWELAVLRFEGKDITDFDLEYSTPITDNVLGHLSDSEVDEILGQIERLPKMVK